VAAGPGTVLGGQGKTVLDPDFDVDDGGLPHEKPALQEIADLEMLLSGWV